MAVGVLEVYAAAAVVSADLAGPFPVWIGPVLKAPVTDAREDLVEFFFADQEILMLVGNLAVVFVEVVGHVVVEREDEHRPERCGARQPKTSVKKVADFCLSRHQTIVWFNCTLTLRVSIPVAAPHVGL